MNQIEQLQNELSEATCDLINAVALASEWQGQAVQLRDRIERALHVLRNAARQDGPYGVFIAAEELNEAIQILEGST